METPAEAVLKSIAMGVAHGCELLAVLLLGVGALECAWTLIRKPLRLNDLQFMKQIWLRFAARIVLALELTLAADIVDTAISPTWNDIGQLAAIATIRTVLNLFLERDIEAFSKQQAEASARKAG
jgi:uncharacterized membrane protein